MPHFCPQCGQPVTELDAVQCPYCGASLSPETGAHASTPLPSASAAPLMPAGPLLPAEPPAAAAWNPAALPPVPQLPQIPFEAAPGFGTFFATVKAVLTHPIDTLQGQRTGEGLFNALAFFLIIQIPTQFFAMFWLWLRQLLITRLLPESQVTPTGLPESLTRIFEMTQHPSMMLMLTLATAGLILSIPFLFISAGIIHFFLRMLGGGKEGFGATVKSLCYAVAPVVLVIIPICGGFVGLIWAMILKFVLIGAAHREPPTNGVLAVLFFYMLKIFSVVVLIILAIILMIGSLGILIGH